MIKICSLIVLAIAILLVCLADYRTNASSSRQAVTQSAAQGHTEWVSESLKEIGTIKAGMTRADLLRVFETEGGLSTDIWRTYAYRQCPYFKVDVEFRPVDRPARDKQGRVTLVESEKDIIIKISKPYLDWSIAD